MPGHLIQLPGSNFSQQGVQQFMSLIANDDYDINDIVWKDVCFSLVSTDFGRFILDVLNSFLDLQVINWIAKIRYVDKCFFLWFILHPLHVHACKSAEITENWTYPYNGNSNAHLINHWYNCEILLIAFILSGWFDYRRNVLHRPCCRARFIMTS